MGTSVAVLLKVGACGAWGARLRPRGGWGGAQLRIGCGNRVQDSEHAERNEAPPGGTDAQQDAYTLLLSEPAHKPRRAR